MQIISSSTSRIYSNLVPLLKRCMETEEESGSMALSPLAYTKTGVVYIPSACLY
jgi:hypothetical protein